MSARDTIFDDAEGEDVARLVVDGTALGLEAYELAPRTQRLRVHDL